MKIGLGTSILASWFCFLFFAGAAAYGLFSRQYVLLPGLVAISGLGFFVLFYLGKVELDDHSIRQTALSGKYEILWDDIKQIEVRESESTLVFRGNKKVLTIFGFIYWSDNAEEVAEFISVQAERRNIPFVEGKRSFRFPKGTKVES